MIYGIDVSIVQARAGIDWSGVVAGGIAFAYVKATEGNGYRDPAFVSLVQGALAAGLEVGAYHFARPSATDQDPARELEALYAASRDLGLTLRPALDLESTALAGPDTYAWAETWAWLAYRYGSDRWPVLYTGSYFWRQLGSRAVESTWASRCPLWLAQYPIDPARSPQAARTYEPNAASWPKAPAPWKTPTIWQYSGNGGKRVPGIKCDVDRDLFLGSIDDLRREVGGAW